MMKRYHTGDEVTIKVLNKNTIDIDSEKREVVFWIGYNQRGIIPFEELGFDVRNMPYEILALFDFPFKAIVTFSKINNTNKSIMIYYLSRKSYNVRTINEIKVGQVYQGPITAIAPWGIFVKIKGGITVFVHCTEVSRSRIDELQKCFMKGDIVNVKIIEKRYENGVCKLYGSRKMTGCDIKPTLGELIPVMITGEIGYYAYFCEVTPGQRGIIHVIRGTEYSIGDKTYGYLTEIEENGFCLRQF